MVRFNSEDQFKFLISCIRWSNNGRIDFTEVAKECGICTKGAAAKRYERMMKAHAIGPEPPYNTKETYDALNKKDSSTTKAKKRKVSSETDGKEEELKTDAEVKRLKKEEVKSPKAAEPTIKEEPQIDTDGHYDFELQPWELDSSFTEPGPMSTLAAEMQMVEPEGQVFQDFIDPAALQQPSAPVLEYPTSEFFHPALPTASFDGAWSHPENRQLDSDDRSEPLIPAETLR